MIRRNKQVVVRKPKNKNKPANEVSASTMVYRGPVVSYSEKQSADLHTQVLVYDFALTSSGAGTIANTLPFENPSATIDWASAVNLYDEYRTLAMEILYVPNAEDVQTPATITAIFPIYTVIDRDSQIALTSYAQATEYGSCVPHTLTKKWSVRMNMEGLSVGNSTGTSSVTGEGLWLNASIPPPACGSIKMFSTGLNSSAAYGRMIVRYRVQFRGRGL